MKRRNLFLSLICSLILTVALVTFTVISIVPKKNSGTNKNPTSESVSDTGNQDVTINEERDGSAEKPFVIYSAETFDTFVVGKYLDENGEYIDYNKVDKEGKLVYPELNAGLHYELDADIDFAGVDFKTIFNKGIAFNGHIDGKGFALKNINVNVTKANIVDEYSYVSDKQLIVNVGVFGAIRDAEIKNLTLDGMNVNLEEGLYEHIWTAEFKTENGTMKSVAVGSIAGVAYNSTIEMAAQVAIDGFAYSVYSNNTADGLFAIGGLVASADTCAISNSTVKAEIVADEGEKYFVGGVAGCAFDTTITKTNVEANVTTHYKQGVDIAGVVGYAINLGVDEVNVNLTVKDNDLVNRIDTSVVTSVENISVAWIAGVVNTIMIDENANVSKINNVKVVADVDIDGMYAGAVMDVVKVKDSKLPAGYYVELTNIFADSKVNVLKAYGFARNLVDTFVNLERVEKDLINGSEVEFNVRLLGQVRLNTYKPANGDKLIPASLFVMGDDNVLINNDITAEKDNKKTIKIVYSAGFLTKIRAAETLNIWGLSLAI